MKNTLPILDDLIANIPETPCEIIRLDNGNILAIKDTSTFPGGSHYYPVYLRLLRDFVLKYPDRDKVLEISSGSAGTALAYICQLIGIHCKIVVPDSDFPRADQMIKSDAEVVFSHKNEGVKGANILLKTMIRTELRNEERVFLGHSSKMASVEALYFLYNEIKSQVNKVLGTDKNINIFISALGNGTSTRAIAEPLLKDNPDAKIIGARYLNPDNLKSLGMPGGDKIDINFPHLKAIILDKTLYIPLPEIQDYAKKYNLGLTSACMRLAVDKYILETGVKNKVFLILNYESREAMY